MTDPTAPALAPAPAIPDKIETIVTVREVLTPRTCHAALANGKIIFGFTAKEVADLPLAEGTRVQVQMNVADFSRGEILAMEG